MLLFFFKSSPLFRKFFQRKIRSWTNEKANRLTPYLKEKNNIIDIGCGNALLSKHLSDLGYTVTALDIANHSVEEGIRPILYDGKTIPFENRSFDVALLITVLHHTEDPIKILKETKRVAQNIIIIEDTYTNLIQKYLTFLTDTIVNLGHSRMTYQNKSEKGWERVFDALGLKLVEKTNKKVLFFFRQTTYLLQVT